MSPANIKQLREKLGMTQAELGKALGITRLAVSHYEIGFRPLVRTPLILMRVLDSLSKPKALELVFLLKKFSDEPKAKSKGRNT